MSKSFSSAITNELANKDHHWTINLVEMIIDPTDVNDILRLTDHYKDVVLDGNTFTAAGSMLGIGQTTESIEATNDSLQIQMSGIGSELIAPILNTPVAGSRVRIYKAFIDEDLGVIIGAPYLVWSGIANSFSIEDTYEHTSEDKVTIAVSCKSLLSTIMDRQSGLYTSLSSYQNKYSTDYSMEFVAGLSDRNFNFGKQN